MALLGAERELQDAAAGYSVFGRFPGNPAHLMNPEVNLVSAYILFEGK